MTAIDRVLDALRGHDCEVERALSGARRQERVALDLQGQRGAVVTCHANCSASAVVDALGLRVRDLFDDAPEGGSARPQIDRIYPYTDEMGELLFEVVRFSPKGFRQRRPDGNGGWGWKLNGVRRVPYPLPAVQKAVVNGVTPPRPSIDRPQAPAATTSRTSTDLPTLAPANRATAARGG